jgi:predicted metal-dependent HD superfamily phosphohydrolase
VFIRYLTTAGQSRLEAGAAAAGPGTLASVDNLLAAFRAALPGADPARADDVARDLIARWSEPHRRYHTLDHLRFMLSIAADADPDVLLACWFHDAIYDPRRPDNEQASAALAVSALTGLGVPSTEVARLVLLTATHDPGPDDQNGLLLCDADLAILATSPAEYARYAVAVRDEYAHVHDDAFRIGRSAVLRKLLDIPAIYRLKRHQGWEKPARVNMHNEMSVLTDGLMTRQPFDP